MTENNDLLPPLFVPRGKVCHDSLEVPEPGTTVRINDGKRRAQDGPFADKKEQLGGFEVPSLDEAWWVKQTRSHACGDVALHRPIAKGSSPE